MDQRRLDRLAELFEHALTLPSVDRRSYATEACSDDPELHAELMSLLAAYEEAPDCLERLAARLRPAALAPIPDSISLGTSATPATVGRTSRDDVPLTVTVVREAQPSGVHSLQVLLRRRLRILFLGFALVAGLGTIALFWTRVLPTLRQGPITPFIWMGLAHYTLLVATAAVCASILWSSRPLSFGRFEPWNSWAFRAWPGSKWCASMPRGAPAKSLVMSADALGMTILSGRQSLIWFALIVA